MWTLGCHLTGPIGHVRNENITRDAHLVDANGRYKEQ